VSVGSREHLNAKPMLGDFYNAVEFLTE